MLPQHHLLQLSPLRVESALRRLQAQIWSQSVALTVSTTQAGPELRGWAEAKRLPLSAAVPGTAWGKLFDQRWCRIVLPRKTGRDDWFAWKDQGEATLYLKGEPYFGFDVGHPYCRLPAGIEELWVEANCVHSAIWHPESRRLSAEGSLFEGAALYRRNDDAWHAYHDLKCLYDVALNLRQQENPSLLPQHVSPGCVQPSVQNHSPVFRRMLRLMDDAVDVFDHRGAAAASKLLATAYRELKTDRAFLQCVLTGHAHIDLVWLWPERIGELKAVHTFSTVNRLMDEYPEFRFAYSQPASYEAVKRRNPGLYGKVRQRIREGTWQATGTMYVESDTLIACGEALLRSFLIGQKSFLEINGTSSKVTWLPDVFGYSACLPQMMQMAGVNYFFTTKMTWSMVNRFPYSSFLWRGNDGSEVIAHVTQDCGYNSQTEVSELKSSSWGHQQSDLHGEYLLPTGYGDGGGGPTAEMCERAKRLSGLPGMPNLTWGHPEEFFARMEPIRAQLPVYQGECYLEGHRGTFTTHGEMKAVFRGLERALQVSEAVSAVTGKSWSREHPWKRLVFSQFHDFIPGSSVWDVYQEGIPELRGLAETEQKKATGALQRAQGDPCLFNPHAVAVKRWVKHPRNGKPVHVALPALAGIPLDQAAVEVSASVEVKGSRVSNGLAEFALDANGWLKLWSSEGKQISLSGPAGQLVFYHDQPARFEAWDLDRQTLANGTLCTAPATIKPFREGTHRAGLKVRRKIGEHSEAEVSFYLEAGSPLLQVTVDLDWQDAHALLKITMPTRHGAPHARFGIPYGSLLRPQIVNGPISEAMWEVPFSRWLAVFDEGEREGVFAVTENKYGASVREGTVGISLVRSPLMVGQDGMRMAWPPQLSRFKSPPKYTDQGKHSIRLAFGRYHSGLVRENHPASLADTLFTDPIVYTGKSLNSALESLTGGETLIPAWAQPLDSKAWILRLHEVGGQRGRAEFVTAKGWKSAPCDVSGRPLTATRRKTLLDFNPHQIVTLLFEKEGHKT